MRKAIVITILYILINFAFAAQTSAQVAIAGASAQIKRQEAQADYRVETLRVYLSKHNSPLAEYAEVFVQTADKYNIDWRLVPAISGVESTFGKRIPRGSYNAYGWANGNYAFKSWEDSIDIVSRTLKENYIDRGATSIAKIARIYAPPSSTWAGKVKFFMRKIDSFPIAFTLEV